MRTLGIEEEYLLLDPKTGLPVARATDIEDKLERTDSINRAEIQRELLNCQIETATPICDTLTQAEESLLHFRRKLSAAARRAGVCAAGTAAAPRIEAHYPELTDKKRYHELKASAPGIVGDQFVNGLHIHVGIPDRETGVRALNRIRPWIPVITALSGNSPFWLDRDSGFSSWRVVHYRRWAVQGIAPVFADAADYERRIDAIAATGVIIDRGVLTWMARLSENYPTLELRSSDAQLEAQDAVLIGALTRGLVARAIEDAVADVPLFDPHPELLDAALWQAARDGLTGQCVDLRAGALVPARTRIGQLLDYIGSALDAAGDTDWVLAGLESVWDQGTGAQRQRRAMKSGGMAALLDLYRATLTYEREPQWNP